MTLVTESDISRSAQAAWKAVFGMPLPVAAPPKSRAPAKDRMLLAQVSIEGGVSRSLLIICPWEEAQRMAARFFRKDPSSMDEALVRDVFGELVNMIGGLIKRHFPHSSRLSLPEVRETPPDGPQGKILAQADFECGTGPLAVRLVQNLS